jgi:hypothetical protein
MRHNYHETHIPEVYFKIKLPGSDEIIEKSYPFDTPMGYRVTDIALNMLHEEHPDLTYWSLISVLYRKPGVKYND